MGGRSALFKPPRGTMVAQCVMSCAPLILLAAAPAAGQAPLRPGPAMPPALWDPAAPYITAGQDEPGYRSWYLAAPWRAGQVRQFNDYLIDLSGRAASSRPGSCSAPRPRGRIAAAQPFEIPPTSEWPHVVQTLRYIHDYVIPAVGPVEPVSGYRNPSLNQCAGGAPESAHKHYSAIDLVPLRPITREELMKALCVSHSEHGAAYNAGLGFYAYLRFHIDSTKFRRWNMDPAVAALCPAIVHTDDIATVGQPLPGSSSSAHRCGGRRDARHAASRPLPSSTPSTPMPKN